ncbi:MAG: UDP-3-O-(3-hydroxymyristoyl)glucosamine N-acyltransferase [Leptospira sp.]|nr:UDP-3-O-(3-hydroxymyristoyl)glucosamine N-acyltransferase [Leptospira sp.]NCS93801.1 UDP-3-O-(3-hydroxymyristoyl)glucosamine N-acyltransferase [Leptospira sp.]
MKLKELSDQLGLSFFGEPNLDITTVRDLAFPTPILESAIYLVTSKKVLEKNKLSKSIKIVLTTEKLKSEFPNGIIADEKIIKLKFANLLGIFEPPSHYPSGISDKASIHPTAILGKNVTVMDFTVVMEGAKIGDNSTIHPHTILEPYSEIGNSTVIRGNVVIGYRCKVGSDCIIHSNSTLGADGFGFIDVAGERHKIPQIGNVEIADHVEIGANCTIDRAAIETTSVGEYTKIDDHVHIGHNCRIGRYVYIAGTAGFAGGVVVEDYVMVGGQCAIAEHITLKKGSLIMGLTGVTKDTEEKGMYFGIPARNATEMLRVSSVLGDLPELMKRVKKLEEKS